MTQPLVLHQKGRPFMQNQFEHTNQQILFEPIKPRRHRRKRRFEETGIEINGNAKPCMDKNKIKQNDSDGTVVAFMKPSNKRRRTNTMNGKESAMILNKHTDVQTMDENN